MKKAAFFDVDNTLIDMKSMFHFYRYWAEMKGYQDRYHIYITNFEKDYPSVSRTILNKNYYKEFKNENLDELFEQGKRWFEHYFSEAPPFIIETVARLNQHKKDGYKIVFVSGSMLPLLEPLRKKLGVDDILCTTLAIQEGKLTGEILPPQTIADGKRTAMENYAQLNNISLADSYGYGDDLSDIPMLSCVRHAVCLDTHAALIDYAKQKSWEILPVKLQRSSSLT